MRKFLIIVIFLALAVIFLPWLHPRAEAAVIGPDQARVAKFWIGQKYYEVDGKRYDMDVAPYVKNDRTMMPARFLAYSLGIPEENITWNENTQTVNIERGPYPAQKETWSTLPPEKRNDYIYIEIGKQNFTVNGYFYGKFDVLPEVVPPGCTMIPYRAVAQALGALVFWDDAEQCVTVETWRDVPPPTVSSVKRVDVSNGSNIATVLMVDGNQKTVITDYTTYVTDPRDGGFTLDAIEWFKLWGVPENSILYDPVRGGLAVRAGDSKFTLSMDDTMGRVAAGYLYFYSGEKNAWNNFFLKTNFSPTDINKAGYNVVLSGRFYSDAAARYAITELFGKTVGGGSKGNESLYNIINN